MLCTHYFHHNDLDGRVSAAVMYEWVKLMMPRYKKHIFHEVTYSDTIDFSDIPENDMIIFTDYSFSDNDNLKAFKNIIRKNCYDIIWIDHHNTSKDIMDTQFELWRDDKRTRFDCLVDTLYCASKLCYLYCIDRISGIRNFGVVETPESACISIIQYTNDHDLWINKLKDTELFHLGSQLYRIKPRYLFKDMLEGNNLSIFDYTNSKVIEASDKFVEKMIDLGRPAKAYKDMQDAFYRKLTGFECSIIDKRYPENEPYSVYCVNAIGNSSVTGDEYNNHDMVILFVYNGDHYKYSIFSRHGKDGHPLDCSKLAALLGSTKRGLSGGGHISAAGFQHKDLLVSKDCTITISNSVFGDKATVYLKNKDGITKL